MLCLAIVGVIIWILQTSGLFNFQDSAKKPTLEDDSSEKEKKQKLIIVIV